MTGPTTPARAPTPQRRRATRAAKAQRSRTLEGARATTTPRRVTCQRARTRFKKIYKTRTSYFTKRTSRKKKKFS